MVSEFYDGLDDTPLGSVVSLNSEGASVQEVYQRSPSVISISSEDSSDEEGPLQSPASALNVSAEASVYKPSLGAPSTISFDSSALPSLAENHSNSAQDDLFEEI